MQLVILATAVILASAFGAKTVKTKNGYTLTLDNKATNVPASTIQGYIDTFFATYPQMCSTYAPSCCKNIVITVDPAHTKNPAEASAPGCNILVNAQFSKDAPNDWDVITHEGFHMTQAYIDAPGWIYECYADYVRDALGVNNAAAGWKLPGYLPTMHWTDGYGNCSSFFKWIDTKYPGVVKKVEQKLRTTKYADSWWKTETTKTIQQLWDAYAQEYTVLTFYSEPEFEGESKQWAGQGEDCNNFLAYQFNDKVAAVNTGGGCVILYSDIDCDGDQIKVAPGCGQPECECSYHADLGWDCDFSGKASSHRLC